MRGKSKYKGDYYLLFSGNLLEEIILLRYTHVCKALRNMVGMGKFDTEERQVQPFCFKRGGRSAEVEWSTPWSEHPWLGSCSAHPHVLPSVPDQDTELHTAVSGVVSADAWQLCCVYHDCKILWASEKIEKHHVVCTIYLQLNKVIAHSNLVLTNSQLCQSLILNYSNNSVVFFQ